VKKAACNFVVVGRARSRRTRSSLSTNKTTAPVSLSLFFFLPPRLGSGYTHTRSARARIYKNAGAVGEKAAKKKCASCCFSQRGKRAREKKGAVVVGPCKKRTRNMFFWGVGGVQKVVKLSLSPPAQTSPGPSIFFSPLAPQAVKRRREVAARRGEREGARRQREERERALSSLQARPHPSPRQPSIPIRPFTCGRRRPSPSRSGPCRPRPASGT